jgi:hypothetical protein
MKLSGALALMLTVGICDASQAQLFQATNAQFSVAVSNDGNYTVINPAINGTISRSSLTGGRLFFSFTILGLQPAIDFLQQNNWTLPANVVVYAGVPALASIPCGITQEKWQQIGNALLNKFNTDRYFTFRTWMYTDQTTYQYLNLIVRDNNGTEITRASITITP